MDGITKTEFKPNDKLTKEQVANMVGVYYNKYIGSTKSLPTVNFTDLNQVSSWAKAGVLGTRSIFQNAGIADQAFNPKSTFTREEAAKLLTYLHKQKNEDKTDNTKSQPNPKDANDEKQKDTKQLKEPKNIQELKKLLDSEVARPYHPTDEQQKMLDMVNAERAKVGVKPLKFMGALEPFTQKRAEQAHEFNTTVYSLKQKISITEQILIYYQMVKTSIVFLKTQDLICLQKM